jgi:Cu+-exporting ATPase
MIDIGDQIVIGPHSLLPCDAYVIDGNSDVDESLVTGESLPVSKTVGDFLLAGTRNGSSVLTAIVQNDQRSSFLMNLIESVASAHESKVGIEEVIGYVTQYFVAGIMLLALARGIGVFLCLRESTSILVKIKLAATASMIVLTAACPCALGLSTPSAIMAGLGS